MDPRTGARSVRGEAYHARAAVLIGALALAVRAGVPVLPALRDHARAHADVIASSAWHAAQAVGVLGREAPEALWLACVADLDVRPWAPWTVIAAHALGDAAVSPARSPPAAPAAMSADSKR